MDLTDSKSSSSFCGPEDLTVGGATAPQSPSSFLRTWIKAGYPEVGVLTPGIWWGSWEVEEKSPVAQGPQPGTGSVSLETETCSKVPAP